MKDLLGMVLLYLKGAKSSKTITINALLTFIIIAYAKKYGIEVDPETAIMLTAGVFTALNWILRGVTNTSLPQKALQAKLKKPKWASVLAEEMLDQLEERNRMRQAKNVIPRPPKEE